MNARWSTAAFVVGALAGFAASEFGWLYLPLAILVVALSVPVFVSRGRAPDWPWVLVGVGLIPTLLLGKSLLESTDPTVHVDPSTAPAFVIYLLILAIGIGGVIAMAVSGRRRLRS